MGQPPGRRNAGSSATAGPDASQPSISTGRPPATLFVRQTKGTPANNGANDRDTVPGYSLLIVPTIGARRFSWAGRGGRRADSVPSRPAVRVVQAHEPKGRPRRTARRIALNLGLLGQVGPQGVPLDIAVDGQEMLVALDREGLEAPPGTDDRSRRYDSACASAWCGCA